MSESITSLLQEEADKPELELVNTDLETHLKGFAMQIPNPSYKLIGSKDLEEKMKAIEDRDKFFRNNPAAFALLPNTTLTQSQWKESGMRGEYDPTKTFPFVPAIQGSGDLFIGDLYVNQAVQARNLIANIEGITVPNKTFIKKADLELENSTKASSLINIAENNIPHPQHKAYNGEDIFEETTKRALHYTNNPEKLDELPKTTLTVDQWQQLGQELPWDPMKKFTFIPSLNREGNEIIMSDIFDGKRRIGSGSGFKLNLNHVAVSDNITN
jgi:hypothetical protein